MYNYHIEENNHCTIITIPVKKSFLLIALCVMMLSTAAAILMSNITSVQGIEKLILIYIVGVFAFIAIVGLCILLSGKEIITCYQDHLTIKHRLYFIKLKRKYTYNKISDLRVYKKDKSQVAISKTRKRNDFKISLSYNISYHGPIILFKYKDRPVKSGYFINEKEGHLLIDVMKEKIVKFKDDRDEYYGLKQH